QLSPSAAMILERAMGGAGRFGGQFVLGHTDEAARLTGIQNSDTAKSLTIRPSTPVIDQMVQQGSITVDGGSLTVLQLRDTEFDIHLIAETRRSTILNQKRVGDLVHIETDMLFKYVEKIVGKSEKGLSLEKLSAFGF